jgi:hypothetical protein
MGDGPMLAVEDQKPGSIALGQRRTGDQLVGKVEFVVGESQRSAGGHFLVPPAEALGRT